MTTNPSKGPKQPQPTLPPGVSPAPNDDKSSPLDWDDLLGPASPSPAAKPPAEKAKVAKPQATAKPVAVGSKAAAKTPAVEKKAAKPSLVATKTGMPHRRRRAWVFPATVGGIMLTVAVLGGLLLWANSHSRDSDRPVAAKTVKTTDEPKKEKTKDAPPTKHDFLTDVGETPVSAVETKGTAPDIDPAKADAKKYKDKAPKSAEPNDSDDSTEIVAPQLAAQGADQPKQEEPRVEVNAPIAEPTPEPKATKEPAAAAVAERPAEYGEQEILDLYTRKQLFTKEGYTTLRGVFAKRFEQRHEQDIRQAFGGDYDDMAAWLKSHSDIKEDFYTAIDDRCDNVVAALEIFRDLKKEFPEQIEPFANLAIAVAVTWDRPERGVYDYTHHQTRAKSTLPEGQLDAKGNFKYYANSPRGIHERIQFLPWEFLAHLVNHRTPAKERNWAVANYLPRRAQYGKCYSDVPYDDLMLKTESDKAKLNNKAYTLQNILTIGGVCAMQADFAARVGKSIGAPAEYVHGPSSFGDLHAWVMWVELQSVTKKGFKFTLESSGRYPYDKFYVGGLTDPHTGMETTDRELELRLHAIGANPVAHRHATLVMMAYPMLKEKAKMKVTEQLVFLNQVIKLSQWNVEPWLALAKMSRDGLLVKEHVRQAQVMLDKLFVTFAVVPDFTWAIFDDLITFQTNLKQRWKLYEKLTTLYEQTGRPDLCCEARLKLTDYLVKEKRFKEAIEGLAYSIKRFPDEGRYVPKMLDRLDEICKQSDIPKTEQHLVRFYKAYLPLVPPKRGDEPSKFCVQMYERGIAVFTAAKQADLVQFYTAQLARLSSPKI